jgi:hypothetical protein
VVAVISNALSNMAVFIIVNGAMDSMCETIIEMIISKFEVQRSTA